MLCRNVATTRNPLMINGHRQLPGRARVNTLRRSVDLQIYTTRPTGAYSGLTVLVTASLSDAESTVGRSINATAVLVGKIVLRYRIPTEPHVVIEQHNWRLRSLKTVGNEGRAANRYRRAGTTQGGLRWRVLVRRIGHNTCAHNCHVNTLNGNSFKPGLGKRICKSFIHRDV